MALLPRILDVLVNADVCTGFEHDIAAGAAQTRVVRPSAGELA
jgi:hypothetical protein